MYTYVYRIGYTDGMAALEHRIRTSREARETLGDTLSRFRSEGIAAEPMVFGAQRKPEAVMIPFETFQALVPLMENLTVAETIRPRIEAGGAAPLSETAAALGLDPADFE